MAQDISERRQVELRLLQKGVAFNSAQEGIVITDKLGCVIDANPAFERISEYSLQEIRGQNMRFMQSGRMDRSFYQNMWQSILTTGYWQGEIWNRRKSGEIFLEWISISAIHDDRSNVVNYIGISTDINRMQHAKSELENLAHHDALTGLPNRLLLLSRLEPCVAKNKPAGWHGCGVVSRSGQVQAGQ